MSQNDGMSDLLVDPKVTEALGKLWTETKSDLALMKAKLKAIIDRKNSDTTLRFAGKQAWADGIRRDADDYIRTGKWRLAEKLFWAPIVSATERASSLDGTMTQARTDAANRAEQENQARIDVTRLQQEQAASREKAEALARAQGRAAALLDTLWGKKWSSPQGSPIAQK